MAQQSKQNNFGFDYRKESGPVECLGMTFKNDDERRAYFSEKLKEKLKDPEFKKIEGFPIGEDEDILSLSDPPYYTACPNPFLEDFVKYYGKPFNAKENYHREPFAADVKEGKSHPIYNAHSYHTKVPHKAIMRYILHYTEPGDIVFDGFCGTGMTAVAAQLCGDKHEIETLGYRVDRNGTVSNQDSQRTSKVGTRYTVMSDLSPGATHIAHQFNKPTDLYNFKIEAESLLKKFENESGWMYSTIYNSDKEEIHLAAEALKRCKTEADCRSLLTTSAALKIKIGKPKSKFNIGKVNSILWSDVFICPETGLEFVLWDAAIDHNEGAIKNQFESPHSGEIVTKRGLERAKLTYFDPLLNKAVTQAKQVPVLMVYHSTNGRSRKKPDEFDKALINKIDSFLPAGWVPIDKLPLGEKTSDPFAMGVTHIHQFYTKRNLRALSFLKKEIQSSSERDLLSWQFDTNIIRQSRMTRLLVSYFFHGGGGWIGGPISLTLYIPSLSIEVQPFETWRNRTKKTIAGTNFNKSHSTATFTCDSGILSLPDNCVDYIFVDPPFGGNIMYSELNILWESWLKVKTNNEAEAITSKKHKKELSDYQFIILRCFREFFRILKPGRWITVEFSNTKAAVWNSIQAAIQEAGFVIANVSALDKKQGSFNAVTSPTAVKQDLVISAYKPDGRLEKRFIKKADTEEGVWDFIQAHLQNLPSVKPKGGRLEFITERDPRILYDRTVAFYVRHGIPVPLSSPEFQTELSDRFPERDGMYFLPNQAADYDKKRIKMEGLGQMTIWVEDERSAADWLRNFLKNKPSKYQEIQPEFFEKLNEAWKKWETRPELRALLDQYFLCYNGQESVPPQIHSYLSTNFKDLRKLPADDPSLRSKAKDRWYVPDPHKNADVEKLREKRLIEEFWTYLPPGYDVEAIKRRMQSRQETLPGMESLPPKVPKGKRLRLVRTEAVRVGFKQCYQFKDYQTIIAVAHYIPENVVNGDDQLQMIYDSAVTRSGLEI